VASMKKNVHTELMEGEEAVEDNKRINKEKS